MIKSIIFDFDGVITDSVDSKGEAFFELFKGNGIKIQNLAKKYHYQNLGVSRYQKIEFILNNYLEKEKNKKEKYLLNFEKLVKKKVIEAKLIYGVLNFLNKNHLNYLFFISSATPTNELKEIIQKKKISKYFKNVFGSPQKKTEHIKFIKKKYKLKNKEIIFIGDTKNDYNSAYKSKIKFIGLKNKYEKFENFDFVIKNFYNFKKKLINLN